jgi:hypothetical protein
LQIFENYSNFGMESLDALKVKNAIENDKVNDEFMQMNE